MIAMQILSVVALLVLSCIHLLASSGISFLAWFTVLTALFIQGSDTFLAVQDVAAGTGLVSGPQVLRQQTGDQLQAERVFPDHSRPIPGPTRLWVLPSP